MPLDPIGINPTAPHWFEALQWNSENGAFDVVAKDHDIIRLLKNWSNKSVKISKRYRDGHYDPQPIIPHNG